MATSERAKATPPYVPFKTLITATDTLKEGIPPQLDRSVWPSLSGGMQSWVMSAFKFLGFIDGEGYPQELLTKWVAAGQDERRVILNRILREKYPTVVALAEQNGTSKAMQDAIGGLGVSGTTKQKAVSFFNKAADFAELSTPAAWKKARTPVGATREKKKQSEEEREGEPTSPPILKADRGRTFTLRSGGTVTIMIDADPWSASAEDRKWLFGLMDHIGEYESSGKDSG